MRDGHNENDELSFLHIAAATANVVRYLSEKKIDGAQEQTGHANEQNGDGVSRELAVIRVENKKRGAW